MLILVLWVISLLGFLAAGLGSQGFFALELSDRLGQELQATYIGQSAVQRAVSILARDSSPTVDGMNEEWINNRALFAEQPSGAGSFTIGYRGDAPDGADVYGVVDEDRKINLNSAPLPVLERLLAVVGGMRATDARAVAEAIADWRDEDKEQRPEGAENFYYLGQDPSYECKDGPFENIEELLLIKGMTPTVYQRIAPSVTVYGSGRVNLNTASRAVLFALGLGEPGVNGLVFYRVGEDNKEATADDRALSSVSAIGSELARYVPAEDINMLTQLAKEDFVGVGSQDFRVSVTAQTESGKGTVHLECVVDRTGQIKAWVER